MLYEETPTVRDGPRHYRQEREAQREVCLLCRVLWPRSLQHRHLAIESSSEAKTLVFTKARPAEYIVA